MSRTPTRRKTFLLIGTLAFAIACSVDPAILGDAMVEGGVLLRDASRSDAAAQEPTRCTQWEVSVWDPDTTGCADLSRSGPDSPCSVPAGWEPWTAQYGDLSGRVALRRCTSP